MRKDVTELAKSSFRRDARTGGLDAHPTRERHPATATSLFNMLLSGRQFRKEASAPEVAAETSRTQFRRTLRGGLADESIRWLAANRLISVGPSGTFRTGLT